MKRVWPSLRRRWKRVLLIALLLAIIGVNAVAYLHARAFTRYGPAGSALGKPETMSFGQKLGVLFTGASHPRPVNDGTPADCGLPYETFSVSCDDVVLEAWRVQHERPRGCVALFHGYGGCKSGLLREAAAFHDLGYECILVDFRAGGGSTGEACTLGVSEADDVAAVSHWVRRRYPTSPIILFGESMGAVAVLRAASQEPTVANALVLECPFDRLLTTVEHRFDAMGLPSFPMARLLVFWGGAQHGFDAFSHNGVDYARNIRLPTLILHGARDPRVRVAECQAVANALSGVKQFEVFPNAGHESYLAADGSHWREAVNTFLGKNVK